MWIWSFPANGFIPFILLDIRILFARFIVAGCFVEIQARLFRIVAAGIGIDRRIEKLIIRAQRYISFTDFFPKYYFA